MPNTSITKASPGQQGFTLIEIIAVLVILGILAAVAVPRFTDLQDEAREKALEGVVAAAQSQLSMEYSRQLLSTGGEETTSWDNVITYCDSESIEDDIATEGFDTTPSIDCSGDGKTLTITVSGDGSATGKISRP